MVKKTKVNLTEELIEQLINTPESGMGYHVVDVYLKNGVIIKNQIVLNCSILTIDKSMVLNVYEIEKLVIL